MTRRRVSLIAAVAVVLLMAAATLTVLAQRAEAAAADWCKAPLWTATTLLYDDDELNTYARAYVKLRQNRNGTCTMTYGYRPDRTYNDRLRCTAGVNTQRIVINPTSFRRYNAPAVYFRCRTYGARVTKTFRPGGRDRCVTGSARAVKRWSPDPVEWMPRRCA